MHTHVCCAIDFHAFPSCQGVSPPCEQDEKPVAATRTGSPTVFIGTSWGHHRDM